MSRDKEMDKVIYIVIGIINEYTQELIRENQAITRKVRKEETWIGRHETCFDCW